MGTMFNTPEGDLSSRRVGGILYLLSALLIAIGGWLMDRYMSFDVWLSIVVIGGSLLGISGLDQFSTKIKSE
jgi:positive regulator of sigma E activity